MVPHLTVDPVYDGSRDLLQRNPEPSIVHALRVDGIQGGLRDLANVQGSAARAERTRSPRPLKPRVGQRARIRAWSYCPAKQVVPKLKVFMVGMLFELPWQVNRSSCECFQPVLESWAIVLFHQSLRNFDDEIRANPYEVRVIGAVMELTKRQAVRNNRFAAGMLVW